MTREERILKVSALYLSISEEKQRVIDCIMNAKEVESIINNDILDANKLNEAIEEIEKLIC
ncbi:TPA: hypothetical protein SHW33_004018 [Clostridioides difficile]|jgi:hypothetical protein|uniref:hypothetical protein n=1 Tax=Clostridioides difficile TaxID=1496 RepID=UPI001027080A|nr:hypothetical protein [Clostridioides difficile]MCP8402580.1 hypothetical protein [Clostridioides difficile]MDO0037851.1 hypothetical protein [Clostridioides difficile]MDX5681778.1 hypothetical protein [Clostridioides difficile]VFD70379.1 Uncharacterised protein [Clostridioides difficile]HBF0668847.1 hypothetical protein [Clostridioides difficile]